MRTLALAALAVALTVSARAQDTPAPLPDEPIVEAPIDGTSIVDLLEADGRFTTLLGALESAGLRATLAEPGPFTLFAPTDSAFAALGDAMVSLSPGDLENVLLLHVVLGAASAEDAVAVGVVPSAWSEHELSITRDDDGTVRVNGIAVIEADQVASNGVVHVVDRVLLPPAEMEDDGGMDDDMDDGMDGDMDDAPDDDGR